MNLPSTYTPQSPLPIVTLNRCRASRCASPTVSLTSVLRQCFTSQPTSSFLSALALPFSILAHANRVTHLALPHTSLWHLLISNNKDHLMSINELKLVPNIHSYSGFTHKGDGKRWIYSSARPVSPTILSSHIEKTCLPTSVILLVELGRGGRPITDMIYISGVFLDINRDVPKDRYLALPLSLLN